MSEKMLKWIIYAAGIVCLYGFISIRSLPVMNAILEEKMIPEHWDFVKYGELYYFNYISHFRKELPEAERKYRYSEKHPELENADILMFGDSFLDISRQTTLPERLNDSIGQRVYYHRFLSPHRSNPMCLLQEEDYGRDRSRIAIYQSVERNIPLRFDEPFDDAVCEDGSPSGTVDRVTDFMEDKVFPANTEELYKQILKRSVLTTDLFSFFATLKFDVFGYISSSTPVYKVAEEPWLFYAPQVGDQPGSFYYQYTDEEIDTYCDNIAIMATRMKEEFALDMVFLPVPSKYTICHRVVNDDPYNEFLPKLYEGLEARGIPYVDLYHTFRKYGEELYYGTDTHWNKKGVDIALHELVETLNRVEGMPVGSQTSYAAP